MRGALYLVEHGATAFADPDRFHGDIDKPLSAEGREEVRDLSTFFKERGLDMVVTDGTERSEQTAKKIADATGASLTHDEGLAAWKLGIFSGIAKPKFDRAVQTYLRHPEVAPPTKGQSMNDFIARWKRAYLKYRGMSRMTGRRIALVVHSLNIGAVTEDFETVDIRAGSSAGVWEVTSSNRLRELA